MRPVSRRAWGARPPSRTYTRVGGTRGVKVHYTGGPVPADIAEPGNHRKCLELVAGIQRMHMSGGRGEVYLDIGYSMIACPHGRVLMGRGPHVLPAANGANLNSGHYAVLALVGSSGFTVPNDALLHAVADAIEYLREHGDAGDEIKGHRDGYSTSCPGGPLYAWVRAGAPRPSTIPPVEPPEEEEMPEVVSLGLEDEIVVPSAQDYQPWWTAEWRDTAGWHPAGGQSIAPTRDVWADVVAHVALRGLTPGEPVEVGLTRHLADGSSVDIAWPTGRLMTVRADVDGRVEANLGGHFKLSALHRGRVTIRHASTGTVTLETSSAFKAILHRYASP
ncbi:peptidoglycan recognition family protein [Streptosporangium sp. NPDC006007]|uniref:peptidoglycan recognition protein family protein n=1 Tax=Streptosporangium sp. NPDC006007 TaxID=3154575 RepID=UPI0033BD19D4